MNCESLQRYFGRTASFWASKNYIGQVYFEIHSPKRALKYVVRANWWKAAIYVAT